MLAVADNIWNVKHFGELAPFHLEKSRAVAYLAVTIIEECDDDAVIQSGAGRHAGPGSRECKRIYFPLDIQTRCALNVPRSDSWESAL